MAVFKIIFAEISNIRSVVITPLCIASPGQVIQRPFYFCSFFRFIQNALSRVSLCNDAKLQVWLDERVREEDLKVVSVGKSDE